MSFTLNLNNTKKKWDIFLKSTSDFSAITLFLVVFRAHIEFNQMGLKMVSSHSEGFLMWLFIVRAKGKWFMLYYWAYNIF